MRTIKNFISISLKLCLLVPKNTGTWVVNTTVAINFKIYFLPLCLIFYCYHGNVINLCCLSFKEAECRQSCVQEDTRRFYRSSHPHVEYEGNYIKEVNTISKIIRIRKRQVKNNIVNLIQLLKP